MVRLTSFCLCLLLLAGCSMQAHTPAPVESLNSKKKPAHPKGSLTSATYKVKKGDTLYSIAWGAGTDYHELAKINQLNKPYTIFPGQILRLSSTAKNTQPTKKTTTASSKPDPKSITSKNDKKQSASQVGVSNQTSVVAQKKTLDPKNKADYAVTSSQQDDNLVAAATEGLPSEVARWLWPAKGRLIGTFSAREQGSKGIKIAGRRGDPVRAAAEGRVVYSGNALRGYGNLVIIKHSEDFLSAYAHLDKILVTEKQRVSAGQTVATMGNTDAEHVMLHFEIRDHGVSVNPLKYLPKK